MLSGETSSVVLHTQGYQRAAARVLLHDRLWKWILRCAVISARGDGERRRPAYLAAALLSPRRWRGWFDGVDDMVRRHRPVGRTFVRKGFECHQNRLLSVVVRSPLMVPSVRRVIGGVVDRWRIEAYLLYGYHPQTGRLEVYGWFVEAVPGGRKPPPRPWLGLEMVWRLVGRRPEFCSYLVTQTAPVGPDRVIAAIARGMGFFMSLIGSVVVAPLVKFVCAARPGHNAHPSRPEISPIKIPDDRPENMSCYDTARAK